MTRSSPRRQRWTLTRLVTSDRPTPAVRAGVAICAAASIVGISLVDYATGRDLSLAVFYLLPVTVGTVLVGTLGGLALAAESAGAWVLADVFIHRAATGAGVQMWNGLLRFAILAIVVLLLSGLREALDIARLSERRGREFLAYAAHQLRTPVAGIRSSAEALLLGGATPEQERLLLHLTTESARAGHLVASLLRVARIDQGEPLEQRSSDIRALCEAETARVQELAPAIRMQLHVEEDVPRELLLSPDATAEALANLLDNARRHAVSLIAVGAAVAGGVVELTVSDDGPGLPPGAEATAFDRFVSLDGRGGAGLGLAIARSLTEAQGGSLTYRAGSFVLALPLRLGVGGRQRAKPLEPADDGSNVALR
jgi:signal transduction histidine kinase